MLNSYLILCAAILLEVFGTILLPLSNGFTRLIPSCIIVVSYILSFYCLSLITDKISLAILYSTWAGSGVFLISVFSYLAYDQRLNIETVIGLIFIVIGVSIVNIFKLPV